MEKNKKIFIILKVISIIVIIAMMLFPILDSYTDIILRIVYGSNYDSMMLFLNNARWWSEGPKTSVFYPGLIINEIICLCAIITIILSFTKYKIKSKKVLGLIILLLVISFFIPYEESFYQNKTTYISIISRILDII